MPGIAMWEMQTEDGSSRLLVTKSMLEHIAMDFRKVARQLKKPTVRRTLSAAKPN